MARNTKVPADHNAPPVTAFQHGLARGFATVLPIPLVIGFTLLLSKPPAHRRTYHPRL